MIAKALYERFQLVEGKLVIERVNRKLYNLQYPEKPAFICNFESNI